MITRADRYETQGWTEWTRGFQFGAALLAFDATDDESLLVIGRELGVEVERLGAYLAPRRFIEKRTILGGPAAPAVREFLERERERLHADRRWLEARRHRLAQARETLEQRTREILAAAE